MPRLHPEAATFLAEIPPGTDGIEATLALMQRVVAEYKWQPEVVGLAREIVAAVPAKSYAQEARALFDFVRANVRYTRDVEGLEYVQAPDITLEVGHGDCDDHATLLAALLAATGHKTRFVAAGFNGGDLEHVWVETLIGDRWFAADTTENRDFGWRPPFITQRIVRYN